MTALYHFWSSPVAQRLRLALGYKQVAWQDRPLAYDDDASFFELGIARQVPVLQLDDGRLLTGSLAILEQLDMLFPGRPILQGIVDHRSWAGLLEWRHAVDALLARLVAPVLPGYRDIAAGAATLAAYKAEVRQRFGMSVEELSNDRYDAYRQFAEQTRLPALAVHLRERRYYTGALSAADMLLAADLYPLQLLDGVTLPMDLMYYFQRVEDGCRISLREGMLAQL